MKEGYKFVLCAACTDDVNKECISFVVLFANEEEYEIMADTGFDQLYSDLNDVLRKKKGSEWYIDDVLESEREGNEKDVVDLDYVRINQKHLVDRE